MWLVVKDWNMAIAKSKREATKPEVSQDCASYFVFPGFGWRGITPPFHTVLKDLYCRLESIFAEIHVLRERQYSLIYTNRTDTNGSFPTIC